MNLQMGSYSPARSFRACLVTTLMVLPCCLLRGPLHWHGYSYFLFLPAVVLADAMFGLGIGMFALALTIFLATIFFMDPVHTLWILPQQIPALTLYGLSAVGAFAAIEGLRLTAHEISVAWRDRWSRRAAAGSGPVTKPKQRSGSVDMWRGFVLCTIFVNHMPGNVFEYITFRNVSLSDSAEAFVFLSGVAMALAYGRKFAAGREGEVAVSLIKRTVKLYGIHVLMSLAAIAIFAAGAIYWRAPGLMAMHGRDLYVKDADAFLAGILSLGHQIGYFNILPIYIALNVAVPVLLYLARIRLDLMLLVSALLYAVSRVYGWNLPSWPIQGGWFFNPFTWQFLLAIGIATGLLMQQNALPKSRFLFVLSGVIVFAGAFVVTNGFGLSFGVRDAVYGWLDLDKTNLGLGRLVQFLALAYFIHGLGVSPRLAAWRALQPLVLLGRNSLLVFVLLSLMAAVGQVLLLTGHDALWLQVVLVVGGLGILYAAAKLTEMEHQSGARLAVARGR